VDNKQEIPARDHTDNGSTGFVVSPGIDDLQERIEKGLDGLLERDPVVMTWILPCLVFVADERDALQDKARIHRRHLTRKIYTTSIQRSGVRHWIRETEYGPTTTVAEWTLEGMLTNTFAGLL
jgi:hypothetical protein